MLTYSLKLASHYDGMVQATFPDVPEAMALAPTLGTGREQV